MNSLVLRCSPSSLLLASTPKYFLQVSILNRSMVCSCLWSMWCGSAQNFDILLVVISFYTLVFKTSSPNSITSRMQCFSTTSKFSMSRRTDPSGLGGRMHFSRLSTLRLSRYCFTPQLCITPVRTRTFLCFFRAIIYYRSVDRYKSWALRNTSGYKKLAILRGTTLGYNANCSQLFLRIVWSSIRVWEFVRICLSLISGSPPRTIFMLFLSQQQAALPNTILLIPYVLMKLLQDCDSARLLLYTSRCSRGISFSVTFPFSLLVTSSLSRAEGIASKGDLLICLKQRLFEKTSSFLGIDSKLLSMKSGRICAMTRSGLIFWMDLYRPAQSLQEKFVDKRVRPTPLRSIWITDPWELSSASFKYLFLDIRKCSLFSSVLVATRVSPLSAALISLSRNCVNSNS